jgi:hypothetical protein
MAHFRVGANNQPDLLLRPELKYDVYDGVGLPVRRRQQWCGS